MIKKILTKKQFINLNNKSYKKMRNDNFLCNKAKDVLIRADKYRWVHKSTWLGEPILNLSEDLFQIQEIVFKTKPDYIVETGVAWGGSALFYATLLHINGGKKFIGIDTYIPKHVEKAVKKNKHIKNKINLIKGSSTDQIVFSKIKKIIKESKKVMVILDSNHTHEHVLNELNLYSKIVKKGFYLICGDTIVNEIPTQRHRKRVWSSSRNPQTALDEFMKKNPSKFRVDMEIYNKMLFSTQPRGYLFALK